MNIREATREDIAEVRELVVSLSSFYLKANQSDLPDWLTESLTEEQFENRVSSTEYMNRVALLDGGLVGYISIKGSGTCTICLCQSNTKAKA